ncbi:TonB-dependent receptor domain-containing protein [Magnetospirillum sulfuroxidans]|uniref:TonB-dependent receptor n=1 Tax=Magnetospirillum sulfuroxidans TaxID=611300 RepID=A0ABS5ICS1_9PROT|nr:TonB-dependent receptor [Magnetospirillum sulfuroxidans]MBR9972221.1 TonB-dependent receptor [Magnetospirillum sulfuroxidans]
MRLRRIPVLLAGAALISTSAAAQESAAIAPTLPKTAVIPVLTQHDKPSPFPLLPLWELGWAPAEMAYRRDKVHPTAGVLDSVANSTAPIKLGAGYTSAGSAKEVFGQTAIRTALATIQASVNYENAGQFADGNGDEVRSGYDRHTEQLALVLRPNADSTLRAMVLHDRIDDQMLPMPVTVNQNGVALPEGFGADPIKTERTLGLLAAETTKPITGLDKLKLELRYVGLERVANNFSLRQETAAANRNIAKPSRYEFGGNLSGEAALAADLAARMTVSTKRIWHDATRWGGPGVNNLSQITGFQYPGIEMWESAADVDLAWKPGAATDINLGVRYDYVTADATKADNLMRIGNYSGTARSLYQSYFGDVDTSGEDHLISLKLDGEHKMVGDRLSLTGSIGRIMRAADSQERYFALPSANNATAAGTATRQVGNPNLNPEVHYRAETGIALKGADWLDYGRKRPGGDNFLGSQSWRVSLSGYVDQVEDFISRDRAHGQSGVLLNDNAFIWRNVDARLAGTEAEAAINLTRNLSTKLALSYRWGENTSDGRALYGIDPLEANWLVDYQDSLSEIGSWNVGFKLRAVASQTRLDADASTGSGFDAANGGGFGLFDLYAGVQFLDTVGVRVGIDNVFDKTYAEHNPANTTDDPNPSAVNGPGRSFYARAIATF